MVSTISNGANDHVKKIGVIMQQYLKPYLRKSKHTKVKNSNPIGDLPSIHSSITINQQCPHHNVPTTQHDMKNNNIAVNFALELHHTLNKALTLCTKNNNIAVNFALELHHTLNKALTFCRHTFYLHYLRTNKSNKKTKQQIIQPIMT